MDTANYLKEAEAIDDSVTPRQLQELLENVMDEMFQRETQAAVMHMSEINLLRRELQERDEIIRNLLVKRAKYRPAHIDGCTCGECRLCRQLEKIVGALPEKPSGKIVQLGR